MYHAVKVLAETGSWERETGNPIMPPNGQRLVDFFICFKRKLSNFIRRHKEATSNYFFKNRNICEISPFPNRYGLPQTGTLEPPVLRRIGYAYMQSVVELSE